METLVERYLQLAARVDDFFGRVSGRHAGEMQCRSGCHDCCEVQLTVTGIEAEVMFRGVATMTPPARAELVARAGRVVADGERRRGPCAALDSAGRCSIYPVRPLVCRSHGVPLRMAPDRPGALPVVDACPRNFAALAGGAAAADQDCILDQTTLLTVLLAIDSAHARLCGRPPGQRFDLAELLASSGQGGQT